MLNDASLNAANPAREPFPGIARNRARAGADPSHISDKNFGFWGNYALGQLRIGAITHWGNYALRQYGFNAIM
jgi:hypothetical protein